ncbi:DUF4142 domain-containing protein [Belnapia rosea]|uniref:DUF4142 domain-containing protein n=1 Tax=Belnapia rosea TaxID=938405 RepID=UPI00088BA8BE|nr:DUF4142 domain-containing protein [Belnapia rosea]SDB74325.1 protein of unknown function [Belnapia rosea]
MRTGFPFAAALAVLAVMPAMAQPQSGRGQTVSPQPGTGRQEQSTQMSGTAGHRGSEVLSAPKFVELAASHAMFETETAKLALERSRDDAQRGFAQAAVAAHTKELEDLRELLARQQPAGVHMPQQMAAQYRTWLSQLRAAQGSDFQALYTQQQAQAHLVAVDLFRNYAQVGDNAALKSWAASRLPVLQDHLAQAQALKGKAPL